MSKQAEINSNKDGSYSKEKMKELEKEMKEEGWTQLVDYMLLKKELKKGYRIRYIVESGGVEKYRSGGWVTYIDKTGEWLRYLGHNMVGFSLQLVDVRKLYYKKRKERKDDRIVVFKKLGKETNFPVYLPDREGKHKVVYYARDNYSLERFMDSQKYERAKINGWKMEE